MGYITSTSSRSALLLLIGFLLPCISSAEYMKGSWGPSQYGERGDRIAHMQVGPRQMDATVFAGKSIAKFGAGGSEGYALDTAGQVYRWGWLYDTGFPFYQFSLWSNPYAYDLAVFGSEPLIDYAAFIESTFPQTINHIAITVTNKVWVRWYFRGDGNQTLAWQNITSSLPPGLTFTRGFTKFDMLFLLASNGSVMAMGRNNFGQLGLGDGGPFDYVYTFTPVDISSMGTDRTVDISIGEAFAMFLTNTGRLYATGLNSDRQLGVPDSDSFFSISLPTLVFSSLNFTSVCSTRQSSVAIGSDGMAYSWGSGIDGELGLGTTTLQVLYPTAMWDRIVSQVGNANATKVACGDHHVIVATNTNLFVTGDGSTLSLALGISPPRKVYNLTLMENELFSFSPFTAGVPNVTAGIGWAGLLISSPNTLFSWGTGLGAAGFPNGANYVSAGSWYSNYWPLPSSGTYLKISSKYFHTLALTTDGGMEAFGAGGSGQLGNGLKTDSYSATRVNTSLVIGDITQICAGGTFSVLLTNLGTVYTWGESSVQCLGRNVSVDTLIPTMITTTGPIAGKVITKIAAGKSSVLAATQDQLLFAWGAPGQYLGDGTSDGSPTPIAVVLGPIASKTISSIAVGESHMLASSTDGTVVSWGYNNVGQLGRGNLSPESQPALVNISALGTDAVVSVHAAGLRSGLLTVSGKIWLWGRVFPFDAPAVNPQLLQWPGSASLLELGTKIMMFVGTDRRLYQFGDETWSNYPNIYGTYNVQKTPLQLDVGSNLDHTVHETYSLSSGEQVGFFVGNMTRSSPQPRASPLPQPTAAPIASSPPRTPPAATPVASSPPVAAGTTCNGSPAPSTDPIWTCSGSVWILLPACFSGGCSVSSSLTIASGATLKLAGENLSNSTITVLGSLSITLNPSAGIVTEVGCVVLGSLTASITVSVPSSVANKTEVFSYEKSCSNFTAPALELTDGAPPCKNFALQESQSSASRVSVSVLFSLPAECSSSLSSNSGAITGGIIGGLAVLVGAAVAAFLLWRRSRDRKTATLDGQEDEELATGRSAAQSASQEGKSAKKAIKAGETEYSAITAKSESISNSLQYLEIIPAGSVKLVHVLGAGSFGKVYFGIYNSAFVAVKELMNPTVQQLEAFLEEARIHFQLPDNPFVCKMHGVLIDVSVKQYAIVLEYCSNGSLFDSRKLIRPEEEYSLFRVVYGVAKGMLSIAANSVVHRDLAARNILLDEHLFPKISDLGMSRKLDQDEQVGKTNTNIGPIAWMSPENFDRQYSEKSDVWSFAQVVIELLTGQNPFSEFDGSLMDLAIAIKKGEVDPLDAIESLSTVPVWLRELLASCFERDPTDRPCFKDICERLQDNCPQLLVRFENELDDVTTGLGRASPNGHYSDGSALSQTDTQTNKRSSSKRHSSKPTSSKHSKGTHRSLTLHSGQVAVAAAKRLGLLGSGSFGEVYLGKLKNRFVAIKRLTDTSGGKVASLLKEAELMLKATPNRNVVQIYGVHIVEDETTADQVVEITMELISRGSLEGYVHNTVSPKEGKVLSSALMYRFLLGMARGMESLARDKLVHRDLAARNILLDAYLEPKVSDFGFARELSDGKDGGKTTAEVGPIRWMAPECMQSKTYSEKSDVWSFGCTIIEMIIADVPFYDLSLIDTVLHVRDKKVTPLQYHRQAIKSLPVDKYVVDLLEKLFPYSPGDRPSFADIVSFLESNAPEDVLKAEARRQKRRQKREKILSAMEEIAL